MKKISLLLTLALTLAVTSCTDYDDDFKALNASISDLNSAVAELKSQVAGFSSLQTGITSLQGSVTALQTAVGSLPGEIGGLKSDLAEAAAEIAALQASLNTMIANYATSEDLAAAQAAINALTSQLTATQEDVATILEANNFYTGNVFITSSATLDFAISLGDKVRIINGDVTVDYTSLTAAEVATANEVTAKIVGVVGNVSLTSTATKGSVDVSALKSIGAAPSGNGNYTVSGMDAMDDDLVFVTGDISFDYDGGYVQPNLVTAKNLLLVNHQTSAANGVVGTLEVNFKGLVTSGTNGVQTATQTISSTSYNAAAKTAVFSHATNVVLNGGVEVLNAMKATNVEVWASNNKAGLNITATTAGSVITVAGRVDNGATGAGNPVGQALTITGHATSIVNANLVGKVGVVDIKADEVHMESMTSATSIDVQEASAIEFPKLASVGAFNAAGSITVSAPLAVLSATLDATLAESIELGSIVGALTAPAVETLKFNALASAFDATGYSALSSLDVTGKNNVAALGLKAGNAALLSFKTAGQIDVVTLTGATKLTAVTFDHTHVTGGNGSSLTVTGNSLLTSVKTSADFVKTLSVTLNPKLTSMDFSSYTSVLTGNVSITIEDNALAGSVTKAVAATPTTAYVENTITQASLSTLKGFVNAYVAANTTSSGFVATTGTLTLSIDIDDVDPSASSTVELSAATSTIKGDFVVLALKIDTIAEFKLIN